MPQYRHLRVDKSGGVVVARFADQWLTNDLAKAELGDELLALGAQDECSKLLLSLAGVTYLSSAMLGKLVSLHKQLEAKGGKLALCELGPAVQEIVTLMKLNKILDVRNTESEGLKAFE
jgi:anti-sigma B factor antagonist